MLTGVAFLSAGVLLAHLGAPENPRWPAVLSLVLFAETVIVGLTLLHGS